MFGTDAQSHRGRSDTLPIQLIGRHLRMRRCIRVNDKAFYIGNISQQREYLQRIDKLPRLFPTTFDFECKNTPTSGRKILTVKSMIAMVG